MLLLSSQTLSKDALSPQQSVRSPTLPSNKLRKLSLRIASIVAALQKCNDYCASPRRFHKFQGLTVIITQLLGSLSRFEDVFIDALFPPMKTGSIILAEWTLLMDTLQQGIVYCDTELISEMSFLDENLLKLSLLKHGRIIIDTIEQFSKQLTELRCENTTM